VRTSWILLAATALVGLGGLILDAGAQSGGAPAAAAPANGKAGENKSSATLALGKKIFVQRCAKCHGEDGTEPVGGGLALSERKLSDEQLAKSVRGRLKSATEAEQKAVFNYIRSFQKK
jgi:mono/diheme cytochrome c family protein